MTIRPPGTVRRDAVKSGSRIFSRPASSITAMATWRFFCAVASSRAKRSFIAPSRAERASAEDFILKDRANKAAQRLREVGCPVQRVEKGRVVKVGHGFNKTATKFKESAKLVPDQRVRFHLVTHVILKLHR